MNNNECLAILCLASEDSGLEDRVREAISAYRPTPRQWRAAHALARAHGHWWAGEKPPAGSIGECVAALFAAASEDDMGGVAPVVDRHGCLVHTTATGRLEWSVSPSGAVRLVVTRKGDVECVEVRITDGGAVSVAFVPETARSRHWATAAAATAAVAGKEGAEVVRRAMPPLLQRAAEQGVALVAPHADALAAAHDAVDADAAVVATTPAFEAARDARERRQAAREAACVDASAAWKTADAAKEAAHAAYMVAYAAYNAPEAFKAACDVMYAAEQAERAARDRVEVAYAARHVDHEGVGEQEVWDAYWEAKQVAQRAHNVSALRDAYDAACAAARALAEKADAELDRVFAPRAPERAAEASAVPEGFRPWGSRRARHVRASA